MEKGKLIPILISAVLLVVAVILFTNNLNNSKHFSVMEIKYNGETSSYENIILDQEIIIGKNTFRVVSINKNQVVLQSIIDIDDNNQFEVTNKESSICFSEDECATLVLK